MRADGGHQDLIVEDGDDVEHALTGGDVEHHVGNRLGGDALELLLGGAGAHQAVQPLDQRSGVQGLLAVGLDRFKGRGERVEAGQDGVDGLAGQSLAALAQQLEDVLHLVRELGDLGEAHGRAHALERVGGPEDLIHRLAVPGVLLQADDRQVQFLQVLLRLGQEHGHVFGGVHYAFR